MGTGYFALALPSANPTFQTPDRSPQSFKLNGILEDIRLP